jgi:hypothetical protein
VGKVIIIKQNKRVVWWCGVGKAGGGGLEMRLLGGEVRSLEIKLKLETKDLYTSTKPKKLI